MFTVIYIDDFGRKHLTVARDLSELHFLEERFDKIEFKPIPQI